MALLAGTKLANLSFAGGGGVAGLALGYFLFAHSTSDPRLGDVANGTPRSKGSWRGEGVLRESVRDQKRFVRIRGDEGLSGANVIVSKELFVRLSRASIAKAGFDRISFRTLRHPLASERTTEVKFEALQSALGLTDEETECIRTIIEDLCDSLADLEVTNHVATLDSPYQLRVDLTAAQQPGRELARDAKEEICRQFGRDLGTLVGEVLDLEEFHLPTFLPPVRILALEPKGQSWRASVAPEPGVLGPKEEIPIHPDRNTPSRMFGDRWSHILKHSGFTIPEELADALAISD